MIVICLWFVKTCLMQSPNNFLYLIYSQLMDINNLTFFYLLYFDAGEWLPHHRN